MTVAERFSHNLIRHRKAAGLSQERLAELASIHRTEISMLERKIRLPRIDTLVKLCGALEVSPDELLEGLEWKPASVQYGRFRTRDQDATL